MPSWLPALALILLAAAPAAGLLGHRFVFDSLTVIRDNPLVHTLDAPWRFFALEYWPPPYTGLYRPLSLLLFSIEWVIGDGSPAVFHAVSIISYSALCLAVYSLARELLSPSAFLAAWGAALIFAVHPVHTEAVASSVNQSELLVALLLTVAATSYIRGRRQGMLSTGRATGILSLYLVACFIKEHAVVLPGILLAAEVTVLRHAGAGGAERSLVRQLRPFYLATVLIALSFITVRGVVLEGDVIGSFAAEALADSSIAGRFLTMLAVVPEWARLLLWPAHLQTDYAPREISAATAWGGGQTLGLILLLLGLAGILAFRRRRPIGSFALLWIAVALIPVHNVLVPTGIILAERTLLLPSVGVALLAGVLISWVVERLPQVRPGIRWLLGAAAVGLVLAGAVRTATRYSVWSDQLTLFRQMVVDAPLSYKAHFGYADLLAQVGDLAGAEEEYRTAIALFPPAVRVYQGLGDLYRRNGLCHPAIAAYREGLGQSSSPDFDDVRRSLVACLLYVGQYRQAGAEARVGIAGGQDDSNFRRFMITADSALAVGAPPGEVNITME